MAKRPSLADRRADDAKGLDAFFNAPTTGPSATEATSVATANADASETIVPTQTLDSAKPVLTKVTLYIRPDQVVAIESIQLSQRQKSGKKPDKSDLVQEALDLLIEKYGPA